MKHTQKMLLIPHEKYERLMQQNNKEIESKPVEESDSNIIENSNDLVNDAEENKLNLNVSEEKTTEKDINSLSVPSTTHSLIENNKEEENQSKANKKRNIPLPGIPDRKIKRQKTNTWKENWKSY